MGLISVGIYQCATGKQIWICDKYQVFFAGTTLHVYNFQLGDSN